MLNVHSLSTQKMPIYGELTDSLLDVVKVPGLPVHYCGSKANSTRTVCSLANQFTQVDNQ